MTAPATLDAEADSIVGEMIRMGARFEVSRDPGVTGELRWFFEAAPSMRASLRRFKADRDLTKPGMPAAMVRAILRTRSPNAP